VRLQTLFSGISAGTELTSYRGSHPQLNKRWDTRQRLFPEDRPTLRYPVEGWGTRRSGPWSRSAPGSTGLQRATCSTPTSTSARTSPRLAARRQLDLGALVTHVISVEEAASAFAILDRQSDQALQVVLKF
jgi:hypothetical protein